LKNYNLVEFTDKLKKEFPFYLAEKWDNVGLQIANENIIIKKVLITLDISYPIVEYAKKHKFSLIISHHPLIFNPLTSILAFDNLISFLIKELLLFNIAVIILHTNIDKLYFNLISKIFNLSNIKPIDAEPQNPEIGIGSYGELPQKITLKNLLNIIKEKLKIEKLRYVGELNKKVKVIGCCGGSGASLINKSLLEKKIDALITSDLKYHTAQYAEHLGIAVIDAGHYHTEKILLPELKKDLKNLFSDSGIIFEISDIITDPLKFY